MNFLIEEPTSRNPYH